jgi:hypothetical protein
MKDPREFTLEEANAMVPELHRRVSAQMLLQNEIKEHLQALHEELGMLPREISVSEEDPEALRNQKEKLIHLLQQFEEGWNKVQQMGCVVKDPRVGLVDFYSKMHNETVWLCWRFGEEAIEHYHSLQEGFADRKPLPTFPTRHRLLS